MCYPLEWSKGDWHCQRSPWADHNCLRNWGGKKLGSWRPAWGAERKYEDHNLCVFLCDKVRLNIWMHVSMCVCKNLTCSFRSLLWIFFNTNVLVNSLRRSQSSQTSSGLISNPKKQLCRLEAFRWRFPSRCLWWVTVDVVFGKKTYINDFSRNIRRPPKDI